ncbi:MAG: DNA gyrase inhibitor YacG [Planctomycetota bacterium]|jgi:endogenous inhibitor of DNA gyrase (YacG/DUF329 family)
MKYRCPACGRVVKYSSGKGLEPVESFPFCSARCKLIDLGVWLDAEYKIASELDPQDSTELPGKKA